MVHRVLSALLDGPSEREEQRLAAACAAAAQQSTQREEAAETAERDIEKCYKAEYMHGHLGESYTGAVSGVTRFGLFVLLPNGVEGLVPAEALPDDSYDYDEDRMTLTGIRTGRAFSLAMPLEVQCVAADAGSGQVTFALQGMPAAPARPPEARQDKPHRPGRKSSPRKRPMHTPKKRRR
jgi:ribonuclease R